MGFEHFPIQFSASLQHFFFLRTFSGKKSKFSNFISQKVWASRLPEESRMTNWLLLLLYNNFTDQSFIELSLRRQFFFKIFEIYSDKTFYKTFSPKHPRQNHRTEFFYNSTFLSHKTVYIIASKSVQINRFSSFIKSTARVIQRNSTSAIWAANFSGRVVSSDVFTAGGGCAVSVRFSERMKENIKKD